MYTQRTGQDATGLWGQGWSGHSIRSHTDHSSRDMRGPYMETGKVRGPEIASLSLVDQTLCFQVILKCVSSESKTETV